MALPNKVLNAKNPPGKACSVLQTLALGSSEVSYSHAINFIVLERKGFSSYSKIQGRSTTETPGISRVNLFLTVFYSA